MNKILNKKSILKKKKKSLIIQTCNSFNLFYENNLQFHLSYQERYCGREFSSLLHSSTCSHSRYHLLLFTFSFSVFLSSIINLDSLTLLLSSLHFQFSLYLSLVSFCFFILSKPKDAKEKKKKKTLFYILKHYFIYFTNLFHNSHNILVSIFTYNSLK